jgi:hypothetical protein
MIQSVFDFLNKYLSEVKDKNDTKIFEGVTIINNYLPGKSGKPGDGTLELYLTLLNIQEELSNKNPYQYKRKSVEPLPDSFEQMNPEIILNLIIMFSGFSSVYSESLKSISKVINVFANKNVFNENDINFYVQDSGISKLILELYNLSLDQNNSLWQAMATNVLPHVIYKVRTITIIPEKVVSSTSEVLKVSINSKNK